MTGNSDSGHTYGGTNEGQSDETTYRELFRQTPSFHHGMVGRPINGCKGVLPYAPKVCKNQIVTASCLHTILDMRPSTTNNPTSNQDPKCTASTKCTLVLGPYSIQN